MRFLSLTLVFVFVFFADAIAQPVSRIDGTSLSLAGTPIVSACGTTPNGSVVGNDGYGAITMGGGAVASCTLSFSATLSAIPVCVVTSTLAVALPVTISTTALVVTAVLTGGKLYYHCFGL